MHATFLVAGFWAKLYTGNILLLTKNRRSKFFCLLLKETWICFNHNIVWQLLHTAVEGQPCVLIFRPSSHFVHFQNWPPRMKPLRKLYPHQKIDKWPTIARQGEWACLQLTEWLISWPTVCDGKCASVLTNTRSNMILRSKISKSHLGTHAFRLKLLQRHKTTAYFWS